MDELVTESESADHWIQVRGVSSGSICETNINEY